MIIIEFDCQRAECFEGYDQDAVIEGDGAAQPEWHLPRHGGQGRPFGVQAPRTSTAGWGGRWSVGRPRVTKGSTCFEKEKGPSVLGAAARRANGGGLVGVCVLVCAGPDSVKSPPLSAAFQEPGAETQSCVPELGVMPAPRNRKILTDGYMTASSLVPAQPGTVGNSLGQAGGTPFPEQWLGMMG